jgi:S-adenosylmethionine synthetase
MSTTRPFCCGRAAGHAGLTGADHRGHLRRYGRLGGCAFSGKDPNEGGPKRGLCRAWVAKNVVTGGLAEQCEVQLAYAIGVASR